MKQKHGDIEAHRKYLAVVPRETVRRRLQVFRLDDSAIEVAPLVCVNLEIRPDDEIWREYLHPLDPVSIDDLKNWFGTPNEVARKQMVTSRGFDAQGRMTGSPVKRVRVADDLPKGKINFAKLAQPQRLAVKQTMNNILYGYVDPEQAKRGSYAAVIDYMVSRAKALRPKVFVAPDLIVCPDDNVVFNGIGTLYFNNILIYGSGQITVNGGAKIQAQQIRHIDE